MDDFIRTTQTKPPLMEYEDVTVPDITDPTVGGEDAVRNLLINFQGSHICLTPDSHIPSSLKLFTGIHSVTGELVMRSHAGDVYMTPVYSRSDVIRGDEIILDFAFLDSGRDFSKHTPDTRSYSLDLAAMFPFDENFSPDNLRSFLDDLQPQVRHASSVTLSGDIPLIPIFFAVILLREVTDDVLRYEGIDAEPIRVF